VCRDNDAKIKAKVESLLHLLAKKKSDEQSLKEVRNISKARYTLPVSTCHVHGLWTRPVNTSVKRMTPGFTGRVGYTGDKHGP